MPTGYSREGLKVAILMNVETNTLGDVVFKVDGLDNVIAYLKTQIEEMGNPYSPESKGFYDGYELCKWSIIGKLQEMPDEVH